MESTPLVSFLLPTRGRSQKLKAVLDSLVETCSSINNFEVVLLFDDDDREHIGEFESWPKNYQYKKQVLKRAGYNNLQVYYNLACSMSSGKWLWVWNDDSRMISRDWDLVIKEYEEEFVILNPWNTREVDKEYLKTHTMFPIVPRVFYEHLGHLSPWNHIDTYLGKIVDGMGLIKNEFRIVHTHDREIDKTLEGVVYLQVPCPSEQCRIDRQKISDYILNQRRS